MHVWMYGRRRVLDYACGGVHTRGGHGLRTVGDLRARGRDVFETVHVVAFKLRSGAVL